MNVTLAHHYRDDFDPTGWFMSEKLDGVRAYWDGYTMWTRNQKRINIPDMWKFVLPKVKLDGELFIGRGQFQDTVSVIRKLQPIEDEWAVVKYMIFDSMQIITDPWSTRYLQASMSVYKPAVMLPHTECKGRQHLNVYFEELVALGAEGVMLRNPLMPYEEKRTHNLLKLKPTKDGLATVVGHIPGLGKHSGRLGALHCQYGKVEFCIGTGFTDAEREDPPPVGKTVKFCCQELTRDGIPRFPRYKGVA